LITAASACAVSSVSALASAASLMWIARSLLLDPQRLLDRELVVRRDDPRDAGRIDGLRITARDLHLGGGVRHLLHGYHDLHDVTPRSDRS
jgi:hypothetical protein